MPLVAPLTIGSLLQRNSKMWLRIAGFASKLYWNSRSLALRMGITCSQEDGCNILRRGMRPPLQSRNLKQGRRCFASPWRPPARRTMYLCDSSHSQLPVNCGQVWWVYWLVPVVDSCRYNHDVVWHVWDAMHWRALSYSVRSARSTTRFAWQQQQFCAVL